MWAPGPRVYPSLPFEKLSLAATTGARSTWTLQFDGYDAPDSMTIAW